MKRYLFAAAFAGAVAACASVVEPAVADDDAALTLTVRGVETLEGHLMIAVFAGEEAWSAYEPVAAERLAVDAAEMSYEFTGLPAGEIAIRLFHDIDDDGELARGVMGIPSEPYAFSNDAAPNMGPPSYAASAFTLEAGANAHAVTLR